MAEYLCISTTFPDRLFHGRADGGEPEWPPSPLRLMQAIVAANADRIGADGPLDRALGWLERQPPPIIVAPRYAEGDPYCLSVPNNAMDLVGKAWARGNYFGSGDSNPATHRTMKTVRPTRMRDGETVHYLWAIDERGVDEQVQTLMLAAERVIALGWGIDMVVGHGQRVSTMELHELHGEWWRPAPSTRTNALRVPVPGTLDGLRDKHHAFIHRMGDEGFVPVPPLTRFEVSGYRRSIDPVARPCAIFELRHDDGEFCRYPQRKLIHIAGMLRHLATEAMKTSLPPGVDENWAERYVAGHRDADDGEHRQLSYLPLPSIGRHHPGQSVRRVMIAAPVGDDGWLEHVARRLTGQQLIPKQGDEFGDAGPPTLVRVYRDNVARRYTQRANRWASVTPVILPGHDDKKPAKTRKLIEAALAQSGVEAGCEFEWSPFSRFRKSFSAHKYNKEGKPTGYLRPDHLPTQTAVHMTITFNDDQEVDGPIAIGAGRHCGLGILAPPIE